VGKIDEVLQALVIGVSLLAVERTECVDRAVPLL
jgi:hypothetical protein